MQGITIGQYMIGDSIIHHLDPRTKLLSCFIIIVVAAFPSQSISRLLMNIAFILLIIYLSQMGITKVLSGLKSLKVLFLLTFICQIFFTGGSPFLDWGIIIITVEGINLAISTMLRLIIIFLGCSLLTMTTSTLMLSAGLESLLSPLTRLRFPVHQFAMMINIALRFIPTIIEETDIIKKAQKSRGASFDTGTIFKRIQSSLAILIPVLAASMQRANDLALALESRGYSGDNLNYMRHNKMGFKTPDYITFIVMLGLLVSALI